MEQKARKKKDEQALCKIALDQCYVAYYPLNDNSYHSLFGKEHRRTNQSAHKRARIRQAALEQFKTSTEATWMPADQQKRLPVTWSVEQEIALFGEAAEREAVSDNRFALGPQQEALLQAATQAERSVAKEPKKAKVIEPKKTEEVQSDDSTSDSESDEEEQMKAEPTAAKKTDDASDSESSSSSSSSDSSSSSSSSSSKEVEVKVEVGKTAANNVQHDDFLVPAVQENVWLHAKESRHENVTGDKSAGWASQRQHTAGRQHYDKRNRK
jgi:hypothetical protein